MPELSRIANLPMVWLSWVNERSVWLLAACYLGALILELGFFALMRRRWSKGDALPNMASALAGLIINSVTGVAFAAIYLGVYEHWRIFTLPITWLGLGAAYLLFELEHYAEHRMAHRVGFYWAIHSVHHSSGDLNVPVASRIMWGIGLTQPLVLLLPLLGISLAQFAFLSLVTNAAGIINHTRAIPKLGLLEHLVVTPANHRVHHGRQLKYLDVNYGQTLLIFDKLFGTHQLEEEEPDYGLVEPDEERNPFMFQTAGFRRLFRQMARADRWSDRLLYLVMPPGWSPDGRHKTTAAMKLAQEARAVAN